VEDGKINYISFSDCEDVELKRAIDESLKLAVDEAIKDEKEVAAKRRLKKRYTYDHVGQCYCTVYVLLDAHILI